MIGRVTMIYPSGSFLVWFEELDAGARGYKSQLGTACEIEVGGRYDFTLSDGVHGHVIEIRVIGTGLRRQGKESATHGRKPIARALASR